MVYSLPSSGKTTLARELSKFSTLGVSSYVLDGDNLRSSINKDLDLVKKIELKIIEELVYCKNTSSQALFQ